MNHRANFHIGLFIILLTVILLMVNGNPHLLTEICYVWLFMCGFILTYGAYKEIEKT